MVPALHIVISAHNPMTDAFMMFADVHIVCRVVIEPCGLDSRIIFLNLGNGFLEFRERKPDNRGLPLD